MPSSRGSLEVLEGDVGLGAMGCNAGNRCTRLAGAAQVLDGADTGYQKDGDPSSSSLVGSDCNQFELVLPHEPVVEAGAAETIPVGDLHDLDARSIKCAHNDSHLLGGELMPQRMASVPKR